MNYQLRAENFCSFYLENNEDHNSKVIDRYFVDCRDPHYDFATLDY